MKLLLDRKEYGDDSTVADLYLDGVWECATMEPEIPVNGKALSGPVCIPPGTYDVLITWSPKFKRRLPLIINVPGRDGVRFHPGNKPDDTAGCVMTGEKVIHVAGVPFLTHSSDAFERFFARLDAAELRGEKNILEVCA